MGSINTETDVTHSQPASILGLDALLIAVIITNDIQLLHTALLSKIPDIQVETNEDRILFLSPKFFLEIKDGIVLMSILASPVIKFRHITIDDTIESALKHL